MLVGALDDFERDGLSGEISLELGAGIAAIGEDPGDERKQPTRLGDEVRR
jgi:hypothetical protein